MYEGLCRGIVNLLERKISCHYCEHFEDASGGKMEYGVCLYRSRGPITEPKGELCERWTEKC